MIKFGLPIYMIRNFLLETLSLKDEEKKYHMICNEVFKDYNLEGKLLFLI
jgi:hypothetical protein